MRQPVRAVSSSRFLLATALLLWCGAAGASTALRPVVTNDGSYGETFTFIADLDDGGYVHVSLGFTNLGPGSIKAICRAVVVSASGHTWQASKRLGGDEWSWSGADPERLSIGACAATADHDNTRVEVPLEGGLVRLRLSAPAVRRIPPDASFGTIDQYYRAEILLYRTRVEATIQLPGALSRTVTGSGYVDHTRSTIKPKELAAQWIRFRGLRGDRGMVLLARRAHDGQVTPAWAAIPPAGVATTARSRWTASVRDGRPLSGSSSRRSTTRSGLTRGDSSSATIPSGSWGSSARSPRPSSVPRSPTRTGHGSRTAMGHLIHGILEVEVADD